MKNTENIASAQNEKEPIILMIEDDKADATLIQKQVMKLWPNCKVIAVESLMDAYNTYQNTYIDLFLLDLNLPDGEGPQTVKKVREFTKDAPVVVVTGINDELVSENVLKYGAQDIVLKSSIMNNEFKDILKRALST